jgi:hypothetical protein
MVPVAMLSDEIDDMVRRSEAALQLPVTFSDLANLLSDEGLGIFFNTSNYLQFAYAYCDLVKRRQLEITIDSMTPMFRPMEPIAVQFLVDEIVYRAAQMNRRRFPLSMRFSFDEPRQEIAVRYGRPQNSQLKEMLEEVAERWKFRGALAFEESGAGVEAVRIIGRSLSSSGGIPNLGGSRPSAGGIGAPGTIVGGFLASSRMMAGRPSTIPPPVMGVAGPRIIR